MSILSENVWPVAETLMQTGEHVCLWGPPGTGKTMLAQARGGVFPDINDSTQVAEVVGHFLPSDSGKWNWHDGPATHALRHGLPLVLNELGRCSGDVKDTLLRYMDNPESLRITLESGETLTHVPGFVVVATSNSNPEEDLSEALRDRLTSLHVTIPHPGLIARIAAESRELAELVGKSYKAGQGQISCRACLRYFKYLKTFDLNIAAELAFGARGRDIVAMLPVAAKGASA